MDSAAFDAHQGAEVQRRPTGVRSPAINALGLGELLESKIETKKRGRRNILLSTIVWFAANFKQGSHEET